MMNIKITALVLFSGIAGLCGCGAGGLGNVTGQVTVDGVAPETGTIHFKPADNPTGRGMGGAIRGGRFEVSDNHPVQPGKYLVSVQAMKDSGKTFNHPQQGVVPILQTVELADSPQEVEVTSDNAQELQLAFAAKKK